MTNHPITLPPTLIHKWARLFITHPDAEVFSTVVQWGADQELEACCEWFKEFYKDESWMNYDLKQFRAARRPNQSKLKEQALAALKDMNLSLDDGHNASIIRQALEALPND
jgi:hypothetical protein